MKIQVKFIVLSVLLLAVSTLCRAAAPKHGSAGCTVRYQNHNQVDYGPLALSAVGGRVLDPSQAAIPKACVGLFTEHGHKLIATKRTDDKGAFGFEGLPDGKYRLVISAGPLCAASVPLLVASQTKSKSTVVVHMRPPGLDSCSYGELEDDPPQ